MTTGELGTLCGAILTGLSGVGAVLRWSAGRITSAIEAGHKVVDRNTEALLEHIKVMTRLEAAVLQTHAATVATKDAVEEVANEVSAVHETPPHWTPPLALVKRKPTEGR